MAKKPVASKKTAAPAKPKKREPERKASVKTPSKPAKKQEKEVVVPATKPAKKKPAAEIVVAPEPKPKKAKRRTVTDDDLLEAIKSLFPEFVRKRKLDSIELTQKQINRFIKKAGGTYAAMTTDQKRVIGLIDADVKKEDADREAAEKAAKTRVSNTDAEADAEAKLKAYNESLAQAANSTQSAKVVKLTNKIISQRLYGLAKNYKRLTIKAAGAFSAALTKLAGEALKRGDNDLSNKLSNSASNNLTRHQTSNEYDAGLVAGSAISPEEENEPFDAVAPYREPDMLAALNADDGNSDGNEGADGEQESEDSQFSKQVATARAEHVAKKRKRAEALASVLASGYRKHMRDVAVAADGDDDLEGYEDNADALVGNNDPANHDVQNPNGGKAAGKKRGRKAKDTVLTLPPIRTNYSDVAFLASSRNFSKGFFNGAKKAGCIGMSFGVIDELNSGESSSIDDLGRRVEFENAHKDWAATSLDLAGNSMLLREVVQAVASELGMALAPEIVPNLVMPAKMHQYLKRNGMTKSFAAVRTNADSTGAFGFMLFVGAHPTGIGAKVQMVPFGVLGISASELPTLCGGDFGNVTDDKLFLFIVKSVLTNGLATRGKVFGFSMRERSLMRPSKPAGSADQEKIVKLPSGKIMILPDVDRRNEFADFRESMQLPESLDDVNVDESGKTDYEKFAGAIVYVDHENNISFFYSMAGKLQTKIYKGACPLNDRDRANLMKPTPFMHGTNFDITDPEDRKAMSPYGANTNVPVPSFPYATIRALENLPQSERDVHGFPGVSYERQGNPGKRGGAYSAVRVTAEDLRTSYNTGDRLYYNAVKDLVDNLVEPGPKHNTTMSGTQGRAIALLDDVNGGMDDNDWNTAGASQAQFLSFRDISALKIALHIAQKSNTEWPEQHILHERAEAARVRPPHVDDLEEVMGKFDGLKPRTEGGNDYYEFMPHQAYIERTLGHQRTAALDCDMGGGKTLMSSLDATRWIKTGVDGAPARPCILMPASLIHNYMKDVRDNFFGKNLNFFVLSSSTRQWSSMDQRKIKEIGLRAPANTFYVCSYEFLGLDSYQIVTGKQSQMVKVMRTEILDNGKTRKVAVKDSKGNDKKVSITVPVTDTVFPNAQLLLDLGINVIYLDESQKIKNKSSSIHKAVQALCEIPVKRIMTGTMVTRDVEDVFTQTSFIDGTMIGTRTRFKALYCEDGTTEIIRGKEKEVRKTITESGVMQVRRSMWMNLLPKKKESFEFVDMSPEQGAVYTILMMDLLNDNKDMLEAASSYYLKQGKIGQEKLERLKQYLLTIMTGSKTDDDDSEASKIVETMRINDVGDADELEDGDDKKAVEALNVAGRNKGKGVESLIEEKKRSIATKASQLQAFISAPQALKPAMFSEKAQAQLEAMNNEMPKSTAKDLLCYNLIEKHWATIGGSYVSMSKQKRQYGEGSDRLRGKVIIFALNNAIVEHVYAYLKTTPLAKQVGIYIKQGEYAAKREQALDDFKNSENEDCAIIVAAETSVIYGQNMQAGDLMIKLTLPWTTGDYDQAVARIYRNGQKLPCEVVNVVTNGSFEVGKLAKFLIRENSNRKLISDYTNNHDLAAALGSLDDAAMVMYQTKEDIENLSYKIYPPGTTAADKKSGRVQPIATRTVDCLELHDDVYKSELREAEKMAEMFTNAGYGVAGQASIPMASGNPVIEGESEAVRVRDPESGEIIPPGPFQLADMQFFNGENLQRARESGNKRGITAEIAKQRAAEMAERLGLSIWETLDDRQRSLALREKVQEAIKAVVAEHEGYRYLLKSADLGEGTDENGTKRMFVASIVNALVSGDARVLVGDFLNRVDSLMHPEVVESGNADSLAEFIVLARLVYNTVLSEFTGTTALDASAEVKRKRDGDWYFAGFNAKPDASIIKSNAKIISAIVSGKAKITAPTEKTGTQQAMENDRARTAQRKADKEVEKSAAEDEDDEDAVEEPGTEEEDIDDEDAEVEEQPKRRQPGNKPSNAPASKPVQAPVSPSSKKPAPVPVEPEGLTLGVAELVDVAEPEIRAGRNVAINDSIYIFASAQYNKPKWLKKLKSVKVGAGRSQLTFERRVMWVYKTPITSTSNITAVAKKLEAAGGFVEKVGTGTKQKYALVAEPTTEALFRVKAPANFDKFDSNNMFGIKQHVAEARTAGKSRAVPEVDLGLLMFDRRIFLVALSTDTDLLAHNGFKQLDLLRVDFENTPAIGKQLNTCFRRIREAGIPIVNGEVIAKKIKILTKQVVTV